MSKNKQVTENIVFAQQETFEGFLILEGKILVRKQSSNIYLQVWSVLSIHNSFIFIIYFICDEHDIITFSH